MKNNVDQKPVTGVYIFGREIKNDGKVISEGERPITHIETEKYSGSGVVQSKQIIKSKGSWHEIWWVKLIFTIISGLFIAYLVFKFGWNK